MKIDDVKDRIRKLFRLAQCAGATEAEAALAADKAQELLDAYKLEASTIRDETEEPAEKAEHFTAPQGKRVPHWRRVLRKACADTTYCFSLSGDDNLWHLFGKPTDAMVCRELYAFLAEQVERLSRDFARGRPRGAGNAFRIGCTSRVRARLLEAFKARQAKHTGEFALVVVNDAAAAKALSRVYAPFQGRGKRSTVRGGDSFNAGLRAGDSVRLNVERKLPSRSGTLLIGN